MAMNTYQVVVIPDLNKNRTLLRTVTAQNATEAAGMVLCALGGGPVDCIEVKQGTGRGHKPASKVVFYCCLYGVERGFLFEERLHVA